MKKLLLSAGILLVSLNLMAQETKTKDAKSIIVQGGKTATDKNGIIVQGGKTADDKNGIIVQGGKEANDKTGIIVQGGKTASDSTDEKNKASKSKMQKK